MGVDALGRENRKKDGAGEDFYLLLPHKDT